MSRVGNKAIEIPDGVDVSLQGNVVLVKGKLGELSQEVSREVNVIIEGKTIKVSIPSKNKKTRQLWGLSRSLINNMVIGVNDGYEKSLELKGVGFRASLNNKYLTLFLGYSHDIKVKIPNGIKVVCEKQTLLKISGYNKEQVGQLAAKIRKLREPEPYKQKGVKYLGEYIRTKVGKTK